MKVAFHFASKNLGSYYGEAIYRKLFGIIFSFRKINLDSMMLVGDFLPGQQWTAEEWPTVLDAMIDRNGHNWKRFDQKNTETLLLENVFIICFETISQSAAESIDEELRKYKPYLGAFELSDSNPVQYMYYAKKLPTMFRITGRKMNMLSADEEWFDESIKELLEEIGFEVSQEITGLYRSVFDDNHNFEAARRIAEWKSSANNLLIGITDNIVGRLLDAAPDLGPKLWSAFTTFDESETVEQLAQVMTSCRRIFEYVTDCIFPPTNKVVDGHSLKKDKYKNRLTQFAAESRASNTNIDLIVASTDTLFLQWDKLLGLINKGVHDDVYRNETRRCLIRTVMLLDDIISLREEPLQIQTKLNASLDKYLKTASKSKRK